jgi:prepilin-type N-terminal cleavage/methylation domain-containing protein
MPTVVVEPADNFSAFSVPQNVGLAKSSGKTVSCEVGMALAITPQTQQTQWEATKMKSQQSGFTLVEIAIVLVIIGLLLGGILKGQELINSAKVKNVANDFRTIQTYVYGFQDKYRALPGDDVAATTHVGSTAAVGNGNGIIEGNWADCTAAAESMKFWQHVRMASLAPGGTTLPTSAAECEDFLPKNAFGGRIGYASYIATTSGTITKNDQITGMSGTYQICSEKILGKFVGQLDLQLDDGKPNSGSMRAIAQGTPGTPTAAATTIDEGSTYIVCMVY